MKYLTHKNILIFIIFQFLFKLIHAAAATSKDNLKWTNRRIPYVIDISLSGYTNLINQAIYDFHSKTCLRFVQRSYEQNYISLFAGAGCYSNVGMIGGQQLVSLGQGCLYKGTIIHNLGHAIGLYREFNRSDRDDYLNIFWKNIQPGMDTQFKKMEPSENLLLTSFDYNSIMMYGKSAFSKDGYSDTMVAINGTQLKETYEKQGMTKLDIMGVNKLYNC